jgi:hypothetical protein
MYHELFADATFWAFLFAIDQDLARAARDKRCPSCGGRLHCANYFRKPCGARNLRDEYRQRLSFCCAGDGCRKRVTPPSVRFLGRKVYLGAVVILVSAMRQGPSPRRVHELTKLFGASRETIYRWREFWNEHFPRTTFWKLARARLVPVFQITEFPRSLLEAFVRSEDDRDGWSKLLLFLAPISITNGLVIKVSEDSGKSAEDADRRS